MLRRFALMLVMFSGLFSLILPAPTTAKADDAPYIYYYSSRINAFIIERADGTDTHILGRGLMPSIGGLADVRGPGWSPSGKWFAWTIAYETGSYGRGLENRYAYAVKADGSHSVEQLNGLNNAQMAWAPDRDLLFVVAQYDESADKPNQPNSTDGYYQHLDFFLFDVNAGTTLIADREVNFIKNGVNSDDDAFPIIVWTNDGRIIVKYESVPIQNIRRTVYYKIFDGRARYAQQLIIGTHENFRSFPSELSSKGEFFTAKGDTLLLENLLADTTKTLGQIPGLANFFEIYWPPNMRYAFVSAHDLYLVNLDKGTAHLLVRQQEQKGSLVVGYNDNLPVWSPDGRHALFIANNILYHLVPETEFLEELPVTIDDHGAFYGNASWNADGTVLISEPHFESNVGYWHHFNFDAGTYQLTSVTSVQAYKDAKLNADRHYAAYIVDGVDIYDTHTNIENVYRPPAESWLAMNQGAVFWDRSGKWLLTFRNGSTGSGGICCDHLGIIRFDGAFQRDLSFVNEVYNPSTMFDWLPLRVKPFDLTPAETKLLFPIPYQVLHGHEWMFDLLWSPNNKQILGSSSSWKYNGVQITQWDIASGSSMPVWESLSMNEKVTWLKSGEDGSYSLTIDYLPHNPSYNDELTQVSPDGSMAVMPWANRFAVRDSQTGELLFDLPNTENYWRVKTKFEIDRHLLAIYYYGVPTTIWDTRTGRLLATLPDSSFDIAFSPDGEWLATTRSWDILLWNVHDLTGQ